MCTVVWSSLQTLFLLLCSELGSHSFSNQSIWTLLQCPLGTCVVTIVLLRMVFQETIVADTESYLTPGVPQCLVDYHAREC